MNRIEYDETYLESSIIKTYQYTNKQVVILEGIFLFRKNLVCLYDPKIRVETTEENCLQGAIYRSNNQELINPETNNCQWCLSKAKEKELLNTKHKVFIPSEKIITEYLINLYSLSKTSKILNVSQPTIKKLCLNSNIHIRAQGKFFDKNIFSNLDIKVPIYLV